MLGLDSFEAARGVVKPTWGADMGIRFLSVCPLSGVPSKRANLFLASMGVSSISIDSAEWKTFGLPDSSDDGEVQSYPPMLDVERSDIEAADWRWSRGMGRLDMMLEVGDLGGSSSSDAKE